MGLEPTLKVLQTDTLTIMLPASLTISNQKNKNTHNTQKKPLNKPKHTQGQCRERESNTRLKGYEPCKLPLLHPNIIKITTTQPYRIFC